MISNVQTITDSLLARSVAGLRFMVAIVGAPGSGKSRLAQDLCKSLQARGETAIVIPMDGFHYDNIILQARGHQHRKGAPFTFDVRGLEVLLKRVKALEPEIAIPVFDRAIELSRAAAGIIQSDTRFILVEGNYLLLQHDPWHRLQQYFDFSIFLDVPIPILEQRLLQRWLDHGFDQAYAQNWIASNDLLNIQTVISDSSPANLTIVQEQA